MKTITILNLLLIILMKSDPSYSKESINLKNDYESEAKQLTLSNNITLDYVEQGDANGLPVILLHGFTDSRHSFDLILPYLPKQLHAFAISQRGHGNSSKPSTGYALTDFADDIAAFMTAMNIDAAILVGHSMSSSITQCFAVRYPDRTKGIVLIGAFANYNNPGMIEFRDYVAQLNDPIDSTFVAEFQISTIEKPIADEQLKLFIKETLKVPASVWKAAAAGWKEGDFTKYLAGSKIPALLVWGSKDGLSSRGDQDALLLALSNSTLTVYDNTGHAVHWEKPERFANDLTQFAFGITK